MEHYDLIVVGSGPGGYVAAERAGELGKRVLLVERDQLGGVCTNWGCIPTKSLLNSAKLFRHAKESTSFGVHADSVTYSMEEAMAWKADTVQTLQKGIAFLMKKSKVEVLHGEASVVDAHRISVDGTEYGCDYLLLATGSSPVVPPIPGSKLDHVLTSKQILGLQQVPENLVVIGGGVVGVEFASYFSMVGAKVTVIEMMDEILPMMDKEFAKLMRRELSAVDFRLGCKVTEITPTEVRYLDPKQEPQSIAASLVLMSVGRRPNTDGLQALGLDMDRKGIVVDERMQTNLPNVYAIGDVNGRSLLAHSASRMADVAVSNIWGNGQRMRYDAIPWAVYADPEAAGCGLTESEAKRRNLSVKCATVQMRSNGRFLAEKGKRAGGLVKVVSDAESGCILGIHLLGPYSSEMICFAAQAIETEMRVKDILELVFPHPSISELIKDACMAISQME
jgi:dihydrolipoamide dehydrogenase